MIQHVYQMGDAARLLGCRQSKLSYMIQIGQVPEPRRLNGRRTFTLRELKAIASILGVSLVVPVVDKEVGYVA